MKLIFSLLVILSIFLSACNSGTSNETEQAKETTTNQEVFAAEPEFFDIIQKGARLETLGEGYKWSEGPVWVDKHKMLLFSDVPGNIIYKYKDGEGVTEYLKGDWTGPNGLNITPEGKLAICQHGDRRIVYMDAPMDAPDDKTFVNIVDNYNGAKFSSPNDLDYDEYGNLYFTDPPYGLAKGDADSLKETEYNGVYRLATDGTVTIIADSLERPNGVVVSNDSKTIYVGQSVNTQAIIAYYNVTPEGKVSSGGVLVDFTSKITDEMGGAVDGLKVHKSGNIISTGPGGIWVVSPKGKILGNIVTGYGTANCEIGGDGYLYITAASQLMRIKLAS